MYGYERSNLSCLLRGKQQDFRRQSCIAVGVSLVSLQRDHLKALWPQFGLYNSLLIFVVTSMSQPILPAFSFFVQSFHFRWKCDIVLVISTWYFGCPSFPKKINPPRALNKTCDQYFLWSAIRRKNTFVILLVPIVALKFSVSTVALWKVHSTNEIASTIYDDRM